MLKLKMKSAPPRGSGWVLPLPIVDFQLPIGFFPNDQSAIDNWQSAMTMTHPLPRGGTDDFIPHEFRHTPLVSTFCTLVLIITLAIGLAGCGFRLSSRPSLATETKAISGASLSQEEKHRLYSAALAASDSPLDTDLFKEVCEEIGIFDANGNPNGNYMAFVQEHVQWGMSTEVNQFRSEINTKEKAKEYVLKHRP